MTALARFRDWSLLLLCNLIWASQFIMVKLVQAQMGPLFAAFFPMLIATLLLAPIVRGKRRDASARDQKRGQSPFFAALSTTGNKAIVPGEKWLTVPAFGARHGIARADVVSFVLLGVLGQVVAQLFITWGVRLSLASNAALISLALPISTAVMAHLILGERMSRLRWISFALAIVGVLGCSGVDWGELHLAGGKFVLGNLMIFASVNGSAFYNTYSKKVLTRYSPLEVLLYSYYAVVVTLLPFTLAAESESFLMLPHFSPMVWFGLAVLALFQYFLSMVIFLNVLTRLDATQAALCNYLIPFFGLVLAALVLKERLTWPMIAGGVLVLAGTVLITAFEKAGD